ncbi:MAG: segregation/condensation protein A [Spirochaetaceae bacterium]|jgi:segregation and condensation protein A|nr:segregation/condensation protein A [Spirochaetaceae bacterium]
MELLAREETSQHAAGHNFRLKEFEGPLDILLFLIKKNEVNLYDIPISEITDQYLSYLKFSSQLDLDDLTDFYATAALLLYIKSRMLLPVEFNEDEEIIDPRNELVEKLIEYQKFKKLSELMEEKEREAEWVIERKKLQRTLPFDDGQLWEKMDVWDLLKTFSKLTHNLSLERIMDLHEEVSINEKIALITEFLETKGECTFTELIVRKGSLMDIVCAFLAILEAVKLRLISIYQNRMFGDIMIRSAEEESLARNSPSAEAANAQ